MSFKKSSVSVKDQFSVILNVYKLAQNFLLDQLGINIYHTAIEFDNVEFAFGFLDREGVSGVYDIRPMSFEDGTFVESITLGTMNRRQFFIKLDKIKRNYLGQSYSILTKNCNHFTNDFSQLLFGLEIPEKFNNFLKFGEFIRNLFTN